MKRIRYGLLITALFFALILSALNVAPALADESEPPVETATEEAPPAEEVNEETEPATTEEEALPTQEETDSVSEEESATVAEVIESLPEDTQLIVVDESGEALPLVSEEAAEVLYNGDPLWCPAGVAPKPGLGGCSPSFTSFNDDSTVPDTGLIDWLEDPLNAAAVSKAGVIWVAYNYAAVGVGEGGAIVLDGTLVAGTMENFALTITGGWNGVVGSTALNTTTPYSTVDEIFAIYNWNNAITINNLLITGVTDPGPSYSALEVITTGNITVNNVDIVNNTTDFGGAYLNNLTGAGNVVVNDSTFNNNTGTSAVGLDIDSNGTVTLKNINANGNTLTGVFIENNTATTAKAVTINGTNHFNFNGWDGLWVVSKGAITLNNVTAMGNTGGSGAELNNCDLGIFCNNVFVSAVTIKGTNNFSNNGWDGLRVHSSSTITISNVTANGNGTDALRPPATNGFDDNNAYGKGVYLNNFGSFAQKNVTLSGVNNFNGNASNGLTAIVSGLLTINNITASENGCDTTTPFEDGDYCAGAYLEAYMGVTQTGYGRFESNAELGLYVSAYYKGAVTLNNLFVDGNGAAGTFVVSDFLFNLAPMNVTINGINTFTGNLGSGLAIDTDGTVTLNNLTANYNGGDGVSVNNDYLLIKAVIIKGINTFNNNTFSGLYVESYGAITTNSITASYNTGDYGVYLDNCEEDGVDACLSLSAQPVIMNGINVANENGDGDDGGIYIISRGAITINNITANYNTGIGVLLWNQYSNAVGAITIKGYATLVGNLAFSGLNAFSTGAITIANLTANDNNTNGAYINNNFDPLKPANVTITGTNIFNNNGTRGLLLVSLGTVLLNNLTANDNGTLGALIDNNGGTVAKTVTLNGNNTFNSNASDGLYIESNGAIKINNVMANNNTGAASNGAELYNNYSIQNQAITITGFGIFNGNGLTGLLAYSNGNITLANITANANINRGADLDAQYNNLTNTTYANVTLTGVNTFNYNGDDGLVIYADGNITVSNVTANFNGTKGAYLDNDIYANIGTTGIRTVTVSGVNMFNGNDYGLDVRSNGTVSLTRITANYNDDGAGDGEGVFVITDGAINLTCGSMYGNTDYGYDLSAGLGKVITLKGVFTFGNGLSNFTNNIPVITRTCALP